MGKKIPGGFKPLRIVSMMKVPFDPILPLELKPRVKGEVGRAKHTPCIGELIEMLDCMKRSGFMDSPCRAAISAYGKCNEDYTAEQQKRKERSAEDISLITNPRDMEKDQIKTLLRNFSAK